MIQDLRCPVFIINFNQEFGLGFQPKHQKIMAPQTQIPQEFRPPVGEAPPLRRNFVHLHAPLSLAAAASDP
ncbi:unnamed protein product [Cuscuta campestris]|uniref:Uncharacterized protein n=1 Tax=Cuscuta campestris TaxID=132261 RepID=A0A484K410_9ASTE|nr:unnamed protein product [Cuscuta campestris]